MQSIFVGFTRLSLKRSDQNSIVQLVIDNESNSKKLTRQLKMITCISYRLLVLYCINLMIKDIREMQK